MALKVGLGHSQDDLEIQGDIDFDFFDESPNQSASNIKTADNVHTVYESEIADTKVKSHDSYRDLESNGIHEKHSVSNQMQQNGGVSEMYAQPVFTETGFRYKITNSGSMGSVKSEPSQDSSYKPRNKLRTRKHRTRWHGSSEKTDSSIDYTVPTDEKTMLGNETTDVFQHKVIKTVIPSLDESEILNLSPTPSNPLKIGSKLEPSSSDERCEGSSGGGSLSSSISMSDSDGMSSLSEDSFEGLTDSESITDVTPLNCNSPYFCDSPRPQSRLTERPKLLTSELGLPPTKRTLVKEMDYFESDVSSSSSSKKKDNVRFLEDVKSMGREEDSGDVNILAAAIKKLEVQQHNLQLSVARARPQALGGDLRTRKNMSFSNDEVRRIDQENQRLLKRIITQQSRQKTKDMAQTKGPFEHVSSSQVSRHKKQRQIEMENVAILKRIESAKPSRDLSRGNLLRDFNRHSNSLARMSPSPASSSSRPSSAALASYSGSLASSKQSFRSNSLSSLSKPNKTNHSQSPPPSNTEETKKSNNISLYKHRNSSE